METSTPFDLSNEIVRWRQALSQSPAIRADNLDELETHLRDTVGELEAKGLSAEEAFVLAVRRFGPPGPVEAEFAKVNPSGVWLHRALWMLIGVQAWALITGAARVAADAVLTGGVALTGTRFSGEIGSVSSAIVPGSVYLVAQISVTLALIAVLALVLGIRGRRAHHSERRTHLSGLVLLIGALGLANLVLYAWNYVWPALSLRFLSAEQFGWMAYSKSLASLGLIVIHTVAMVGVILLLANRLSVTTRRSA